MLEIIQNLNYLLALGGIATIIFSGALIIDLRGAQKLNPYVQKWGLALAFFVTVSSVTMTLIYSDVFGIIPCGLCWLERIALYPQVLLLAVALWLKDTTMPRYGIALSCAGLIISLYHHYIQMGGSQFIKCPAAGAADCAKRFMFEFNFMTFPLLAAILFVFLIVLYLYILKTRTN